MWDKHSFKNMRQVLRALEEERRGRQVFRILKEKQVEIIEGEKFFQDIYSYEMKLAKVLKEKDHVGLIGKSCYEWMVSLCALLDLGAVPVLLSADYGVEEVKDAIKEADISYLLYREEQEEKIREIRGIGLEEMFREEADSPWTAEETEAVKQSLPEYHKGLEDRAIILFTSGTTGKNKVVEISNRGMIASVVNDLVPYSFKAQLAILPFHHMAGYNPLLNTLCLGAVICLMDNPGTLFQAFEIMKADYLFVVPAMAKMIAKRLRRATAHGESLGWDLRMVGCGGARFPSEVLDIFHEKDIVVLQGYGATECGGIGFSCEMDLEHPDIIGKPHELMDVSIQDGELCIKSDSLMTGYYKDPEGTKEVLLDGWYHTGDLAVWDEDGNVRLTGRKKNLIILSNGENISPEGIEKRLQTCPLVTEVIVSDEKDCLAATIYAQDATEGNKEEIEEEIRRFVEAYNEENVSYKKITYLHFREEPFEKNVMMKIIRKRDK